MTEIKVALVIAALALVSGACSSGSSARTLPASFGTTSTARASAAYAFYLAHNPDPALVLSRQDAQARAYLGCGIKWSPATVDGVLAKAYKGICPSARGNYP
jgi:hypothetical protein